MNNCINNISSFDSFVDPDTDGYVFSEKLLQEKNTYLTQKYLQNELYPFLTRYCKTKRNHIVWYKIADFLGPALKQLPHAKNEYCESEYYLIDQRGVSRSLNHTDIFDRELQVLTQVYLESPNIAVLLPFVRDDEQLKQCYKLIQKAKFPGKTGITIDLISTIFVLKEMIASGISNVVVNINNLAVFALGAYDIPAYSLNHDAVFQYICQVEEIMKKSNVEINIAGNISALDMEKYSGFSISNYVCFE